MAALGPSRAAQAQTVEKPRYPFVAADVEFMQGMIHHHSQAVIMSGWCGSHGANASLRIFCGRIATAQTAEIELMQSWLKDRNQPVPDPNATHDMPGMAGHDMAAPLMPGMLSAEQMKQLDAARGADFDRLFLTGMIQHHTGAISMVDKLFGSYGAGQDDVIFKFATDVNADQRTEIDRMQQMLDAMRVP
ncbi:MAG: hypothetical protein JWM95_5634 [Gemmatimonadetes bacterium]|nr:hypothetical protein [Gemmatimonadota bacterium]